MATIEEKYELALQMLSDITNNIAETQHATPSNFDEHIETVIDNPNIFIEDDLEEEEITLQ